MISGFSTPQSCTLRLRVIRVQVLDVQWAEQIYPQGYLPRGEVQAVSGRTLGEGSSLNMLMGRFSTMYTNLFLL